MLKVYLCNSNTDLIKQYTSLVEQSAEENGIDITLSVFDSGEALLFHMSDMSNLADIIYIDILMGKSNGIDTAYKLRELGCRAEIIFTTETEKFVYEAFDVKAFQYLVSEKTSDDKFRKVFLEASKVALKKEREMFLCEFHNMKKMVPIDEISYFEIWRRVVTVHYSGDKTAKFYRSMEQLEKQLKDKNFVRSHRSYIVSLPYINKFEAQSLSLKTGENIPVGVTYMRQVKKEFADYISKSHIHKSE